MPLIDAAFHFRRGTAAQWASVNPVLGAGEPGWESDDGKGKIGNGATAYNSLPYTLGEGAGGAVVSVNGSTGAVILNAASVGAAPTSHSHTALNITDFSEAVQDALAATLVAGANVTLTYDDTAGTLTIAAAGGGGGTVSSVNGQTGAVVLTAANVGASATGHSHTSSSITDMSEAVQDIVGTMVVAGAGITRTYDDTAGTLTIAGAGLSTEEVQDVVGAFVVAGSKIAKTYDDTANTLTVAYAEPTPRTVTASATLALGDANAAIYDTGGSANVLTVPTNASVAFPTDTQVDVWALGAGALTITASATVTLNGVSAGSYTPAQFSRTVLRKTGTNAWVASGGGSTVGTLATAVAGSIFRCPWNGSAWTYAGTALTDRPIARTDIFFQLTGAPYATADPAWMLTGDDRVDL